MALPPVVPSHQHATQVLVPELELEVSTGTLGGLVTTVEGLVQAVGTALKSTQARLWQRGTPIYNWLWLYHGVAQPWRNNSMQSRLGKHTCAV